MTDGTRTFHRVLVNTLIANVTSSYLWFALTFWIYLETRSVMATAIVGGAYMGLVALLGTVFGAIVDHYRKRTAMLASSVITLTTYAVAGVVFLLAGADRVADLGGPWFYLFSCVVLVGGVAEQLRNIALPTTVTLLVPADRRDKANGLVGTVQGVAFMATSVFSGLSVGLLGMGGTLVVAIVLTAVALGHLLPIRIDEPRVVPAEGEAARRIEWRGAVGAIRAVPGLGALIAFTTFNNLVMGVFIALMDPYGLTLFSVETWGLVLGVTSVGFIIGGSIIAKVGLGENPVRTMLWANVGVAVVGILCAIREVPLLYVAMTMGFMILMPFVEATEQTVVQRVVPFDRQGRVFGFAQSVETAAAPISAFLIGPVAELVLIPWMATDAGRSAFGWLLGDGDARGIALTFVVASTIMLIAVLLAFSSRAYRRLSASYAAQPAPVDPVAA